MVYCTCLSRHINTQSTYRVNRVNICNMEAKQCSRQLHFSLFVPVNFNDCAHIFILFFACVSYQEKCVLIFIYYSSLGTWVSNFCVSSLQGQNELLVMIALVCYAFLVVFFLNKLAYIFTSKNKSKASKHFFTLPQFCSQRWISFLLYLYSVQPTKLTLKNT